MADREQIHADQCAFWNGNGGHTWVARQAHQSVSEALLAWAAPRVGERVLDVGCGCRASTLDFARDAATAALQGYDLLTSNFGLTLFGSPMAAFAHLRRAANDGVRLAFVCWRSPAAIAVAISALLALHSHLDRDTLLPIPIVATRGRIGSVHRTGGKSNSRPRVSVRREKRDEAGCLRLYSRNRSRARGASDRPGP